jgi:hypothetical protein
MNKLQILEEKVKQYENFLHKLDMMVTCCNNTGIQELIANAVAWSYSHRCGEHYIDEDRDKLIDIKTKKLCDTPNADALTIERQKKYSQINY